MDAALGRHLEILGQALQRRGVAACGVHATVPATPLARFDFERVVQGEGKNGESALKCALRRSADALVRELSETSLLSTEPPLCPDVVGSGDPESQFEDCQKRVHAKTPPVHDSALVSEPIEFPQRQISPLSDDSRHKLQVPTGQITPGKQDPRASDGSANSPSGRVTISSVVRDADGSRWDDDHKEKKKGRLEAFTTSPSFEVVFAFLITLNTLVMVLEEQYQGSIVGHELGRYKSYGSEAYNHKYMPSAEEVFNGLEIVFAAIFSVEVLLKIIGRGKDYWRDASELMDLLVVLCSNTSLFMQQYAQMDIMIFRVLRLAKLLRMVKLMRTVELLDSLQLMTTAISASVSALFWAVALLFIMQSFVALILTNMLRNEYLLSSDAELTSEQKLVLFEYFGTYARSMLSTFELMLANWPPICRFLTENLNEGWMVAVIAYKLTFGFAFVGVINAVFMQETLNVTVTDDSIMIKARSRAQAVHRRKMQKLLKLADTNNDGFLSFEEFAAVLDSNAAVKLWLEAMDMETRDAKLLFRLLDKNNDNALSVDELTAGFSKLKGIARSVDTQLIIRALIKQWFPDFPREAGGDAVLLNEVAPVFQSSGWQSSRSIDRTPT